ncbi:T9SS type B sorting domain-containing protein, partial [Mesonia sp. K4-1]|uniref:T9SS type B sorting domain-containing protein n=2 Tax=Mesonia sp. K4-1 TaxID=2602760 RepID=UPI0011CC0E30
TAPAVYELCDSGTGQAQFDLSTLDAAVNNDPNVTITYHATQTAADAGTPVLPVLYNSATATIYARVEDNNPPGCYNTIAVDLQVNPNPDVPNALPTLELCDDDTDGIATFNLTDNEATILSNEPSPANFDVTYYANATDLANANAIATETAYDNTTPNTQTIFVLVENLTTGCTTEAQFDITVNPLPSYNAPAPLIICDDASANGTATFTLSNATAQLTGSNPNLNVSYFPSQATAQAGDPNDELPNSYTNTNPFNETIWVRIYNINTQCFVVDSLDLQVDQAPQANKPQDFIYCDDDNDGVGQFILTDLDDEINNDPSVTITYHQTQANADNNVLPLSSPFTNTVNTTQTIYVRVESPGVDCYSTVTATLIVEDSPQPVLAADLDPLEACDDDNSGNAVFDLTQMEPAILANETTPSDFTVTYYQTQNDADNQTNPIGVPAAYTSNGLNQTIYVVVEGLNGCLGETSFELIVNPLPTVNPPSALELCDYNNPGDEQEAFNLNDATLEITGGDNSIDVTYYASQADADAGINPLSSPYTNTVNNETIYIRSVDQDTGCSVTQGYTLTLVVNPLPSPQVPVDPLLVCDADNDGFAEFDLDAQIPIITNGEVNVVVTYHITQANADAGSNPIDTTQPYGIVAGNGVQTIYVRATNSVTGCYVVEVLELEVVSTPEIGTLEDLFVCDDATADGFAIFDLTVNTTNVIGNQNPADVTVTYYETQADAAAGTNAIAVPSMYTNNMNPQRIFVRIENNATGCIDTFDTANDNSFWIEVEENPDVMDPTNLQLCDDDYATNPVPQNIFNLTVKEGEISGQNFPPSSYEFTYYANNADYQAGTAIGDPTAYENQSNPQTIIVEVVDTTTEGMCASTVNLTIEVLPLPSPSEDDQDILRLEECDDDNDGIAATGFDLTQSGDLISAGENVILTYYTTENAAEDGDTTAPEYIADPTNYTNDPSLNITNADGLSVQVIYVRIDSNVNGNFCFVVVSFEIDVVPAPVLNDMDPFGYILCEDGNTGTATIFLDDIAENVYDATLDFDTDPNTTADTSILVPLLDQTENEDLDITNYTVSYHFTQVGAETDTAEVPNGYQATDGERFFIRIEYKDTGCYNTNAIGEVVVTVEERPSIDDVDILEQLCSDEQGGDSVTIDLTQYNGQINPGSPANTQVVYYATMNDYMAGIAIDPSQLSAYTTVENPQTIIAEVIDTVTLCESELFATIEIEIGESPIIDISSYDGTVLCEDLDPNTPVVGGDYSSVTIETGLSTTQYDFEWTQNGATLMETGSSLTVSEPGTYEVTVTDPLTGCASTSSATFASGNPPEFTVESTTFGFNGEHALLISNVIGAGDYEFSVDNGPWIALGAEGTLTLDGLSGGVHEVRGRDRNGCGITLNEVFFIDYPKFFTPNQDGYNDTWNIQGISNQLDAKIYIFDRYGKLLKQLSPSSPGWDGTYNGKLMPSNDYWFRVEYTDIDGTRKEFKANFTLKR